MKKLLAIFAFFISGFVSYVVADVTAPSGRFLQIRDTLQPSSTVYFSSGTVQSYLAANGVMSLPHSATPPPGDCGADNQRGRIYIDTNAVSGQQIYVCEGTLGWIAQTAGGAGVPQTTIFLKDGGSSIVNTSTVNFAGAAFIVSNSGGEGLVEIDFSSITSRSSAILLQNTLQSGATFYVSSGTVNGQLSVMQIKFPDGTIQVSSPTAGAGSSPGGGFTNVQFNDAGTFGGESNFSWDKSSDTLTLFGNHPYTTPLASNNALIIISTTPAASLPGSGLQWAYLENSVSTRAVFRILPVQYVSGTSTGTLVNFNVGAFGIAATSNTVMQLGYTNIGADKYPQLIFPFSNTRLKWGGSGAYIEVDSASSDMVIEPTSLSNRLRIGSGSGTTRSLLFDTASNDGDLQWDGTNDVFKYSDDIQMQAQNELRLADSDSSNYTGFKSSATVASNVVFVVPSADGTSGQALVTDGNRNLSFTTISGSGGGGGVTVYPATATASFPFGFLASSTSTFNNNSDIILSSTTRIVIPNTNTSYPERPIFSVFSNSASPSGPVDTRSSFQRVILPQEPGTNYVLATYGLIVSTNQTGSITDPSFSFTPDLFGVGGQSASLNAGVSSYLTISGFNGSQLNYGISPNQVNRMYVGPKIPAADIGLGFLFMDASTPTFNSYNTPGRIFLAESGSGATDGVVIRSTQSMSGVLILTLPQSDGTAGQAMTTDGSGNLSFNTISGSSVYPATSTASFPFGFSASTGVFTSSVAIQNAIGLQFYDLDETQFVMIKSSSNNTYNMVYVLPNSTGTADQILAIRNVSSNQNNLYWKDDNDTATLPGGSDTYIQYNRSGSFGGDKDFIFDESQSLVKLGFSVDGTFTLGDAAATGDLTLSSDNDLDGTADIFSSDGSKQLDIDMITNFSKATNHDAGLAATTGSFSQLLSPNLGITVGGAESIFNSTIQVRGARQLRFYDADNSHYSSFASTPTLVSTFTYILPVSTTAGNFLKYNDGGQLSWSSHGLTNSVMSMGDANGNLQDSGMTYLASFPGFVGPVHYATNLFSVGGQFGTGYGATISQFDADISNVIKFGPPAAITSDYNFVWPDTKLGPYQVWMSTGPDGNTVNLVNQTVIVSTSGLQTGTTFYVSSGTVSGGFTASTATILTTLQIPSSSNPAILNTGQIGVDTSSAQFVFHDGSNAVVLSSTMTENISISAPAVGQRPFFLRPYADITLTSAVCVSSAATSATLSLQECDANGANCTALTAATACTTTNTTLALTDTAVTAGNRIRVFVTAVSGTPGWTAVDLYYRETRK